MFNRIEADHGRLDVVFNNAGTSRAPTPIEDMAVDDWRAVIDANLTSQFLVARQAVGLMKRQQPTGGRIINNSSISADVPRPLSAAYTASKHGVAGLTKSIALDGRAHGIACGQIKVGNAATRTSCRTDLWAASEGSSPRPGIRQHASMVSAMPEGVLQPDGTIAPEPVIDVGHVASAVMYMAGLPLDVNVLSMTIMATRMPFVGRG